MVWYKANRLQQYKKILKEATIEATKLRILRVKELTVKGAEAELKILAKENI